MPRTCMLTWSIFILLSLISASYQQDPITDDEEIEGTTAKSKLSAMSADSVTRNSSLNTDQQQSMEGSTSHNSTYSNYTTSNYDHDESENAFSWDSHPGIRIAIICAGVLLALLLIAVILFIIYRVRKKDEGSYPLTDSHIKTHNGYTKAPTQEFFA